jgi:U3 small nucleolar RNA-associated protein 4
VQYQHVHGSKILADAMKGSNVDVAIGLGERWVYVGYKRTHSHDVNALVVASPRISGIQSCVFEIY